MTSGRIVKHTVHHARPVRFYRTGRPVGHIYSLVYGE